LRSKLKPLILTAKRRGYVLYEEIDALLPEDCNGGREVDDLLSELDSAGIEIREEPNFEFDRKIDKDLNSDTDDPVHVYLRW
jgi:RNA polymerase primary sigma factor